MARILANVVITSLDLNSLREELERLLPQIRQVADFVGRRNGLSPEDREDLAGDTLLKLAADDYQRLRQFRGEAKFSTFLRVMVTNEANDRLRHERGKIRPASKTRRRGDWACRYELLCRNEGRSRDEALAVLKREGYSIAREQLEELDAEIAARLPPRSFDGPDALESLAASEPNPEQRALAGERRAAGRRLRLALLDALRGLSDEDRGFLRLYCASDAKARAARLAVMYGLPSREAVYRRYHDLCKDLKRRLKLLGFDVEVAKDLLADWPDDDNGDEKAFPGPSRRTGSDDE